MYHLNLVNCIKLVFKSLTVAPSLGPGDLRGPRPELVSGLHYNFVVSVGSEAQETSLFNNSQYNCIVIKHVF